MIRIGLQVDLIGSYGRDVLRGLIQYANLAGNWEFVRPSMYGVERKRKMHSGQIDAAVMMVHSAQSIKTLQRAKVPIVNVSHTLDAAALHRLKLHSVLPDDEGIGRAAYAYLRERGFRSFAFCGHPTVAWSRVRQNAFADLARADGCECSISLMADAVSAAWIAQLPKPVALFAANDRYAWLAVDACRTARVKVPEQLAILGVDDDLLLVDLVRPSLSSIQSSGFQVGVEAGAMLVDLLNGKIVEPRIRLVPLQGIVTRNSCEVLTIGDEAVVSAVQFIRKSAANPIGVSEVVAEVMLSRRNLERKFQTALGRSILQEIRRVRIDRACDLLRDTDFDMPAIARGCGFTSHVRFSTVFQQQLACAPTAFRRKHRVTVVR